MADTPIKQQEGLSEEDFENMKAVEQKFHEVGPTEIIPQQSLTAQKSNLKNLILEGLIEFDKARASASPTDKYANDTCIDSFAEKMTEGICKIIKGQMWNVSTSGTTDVSTTGWDGITKGTSTNVIAPTCITNE